MSEYDKIVSGSYTADGNARTLSLPFVPDWFEMHIRGNGAGDNWNSAANPAVVKSLWWARGMANASALAVQNTAGALTDQRIFIASDGVSAFESDPTLFGTAFTITGITNAAPPVVTTSTNHGYSSGDVVLLTQTTAALQLSTLVYQIAVLSPTTFSLVNMAAPGSAATAGFCRKVLFPSVYLPRLRYIATITLGVTTTVAFTVNHGYVVGESLRFHSNALYGAQQIDGLQGTVLSVTASAVVVDIDSSAFSAWSPATSAEASLGTSFPHACPIGVEQTAVVPANPSSPFQYQLNTSFVDTGSMGVLLGATVAGPSGALVIWRAGLSMKVYTS